MKYLKYIKESEEEIDNTDELENLASVLRQMARQQGFDFHISIEEDHILVEVTMNKEEPFQRVFKLFQFMRKIKKDYLTGFKCDMDLWETKTNKPIFTFEFYYSSVGSAPTYPYYDDDLPY